MQIAPAASQDLQDIKDYIETELANPTAALSVLSRIMKGIRRLATFPDSGVSLSSRIDIQTDYRFLVCGNYLVFYRHVDDTVFVLRVLYSRRDYRVLFGELLEDE